MNSSPSCSSISVSQSSSLSLLLLLEKLLQHLLRLVISAVVLHDCARAADYFACLALLVELALPDHLAQLSLLLYLNDGDLVLEAECTHQLLIVRFVAALRQNAEVRLATEIPRR
jgi:hypothetical protein